MESSGMSKSSRDGEQMIQKRRDAGKKKSGEANKENREGQQRAAIASVLGIELERKRAQDEFTRMQHV